MTTLQISPRVIAVADMVKRFSRQELSQLVTIVPALRSVQRQDEGALVARFHRLGLEQRAGRPASLADPFIGGLSYAEYFALSETEQDAIWEQWFAQASVDMEAMPEVDITADADLSA